jgi:hypothetical protein
MISLNGTPLVLREAIAMWTSKRPFPEFWLDESDYRHLEAAPIKKSMQFRKYLKGGKV